MEVTLKPGAWVDPARMQQTIKDAGYKPGDAGVTLRLTGKVVKQGDQLALELDKMKAPRTLALAAAKEKPEPLARLGALVDQVVQIEGLWTETEGKGATLAVTAVIAPGGKLESG